MGSMNHGGRFAGGGTSTRSPMSLYDSLPKRIRRLLAEAPYDYSTESISEKINEIGPRKAERLIKEKLAYEIQRHVVAAYGPDHPQAK